MDSELHIDLLTEDFDLEGFDSVNEDLNRFLRSFARKHMLRKISQTYVLHRKDELEILAFYSLILGQVKLADIPAASRKKLPNHPVPVVRQERLAVSKDHHDAGYEAHVLIDAIRRAVILSRHFGVYAIDVHANNEDARTFYLNFGFEELQDDRQRLYLPMKTAEQLFHQ